MSMSFGRLMYERVRQGMERRERKVSAIIFERTGTLHSGEKARVLTIGTGRTASPQVYSMMGPPKQ